MPSFQFAPCVVAGMLVAGIMGKADANGDKAISAAELPAWLTAVRESKVAITATDVRVAQNGRPLPAKYNTDTSLGAAVGGMLPMGGMITIDLE